MHSAPDVDHARAEIKSYLSKNLYHAVGLIAGREESQRVLRELFTLWMEEPEKLPLTYQDQLAELPRHRIVCDYIAGMTDSYVLEQHRILCGGSALLQQTC